MILDEPVDLEIVYDPFNMVTVYEYSSRATRTAIMVSSDGSEPEGMYLVLLRSDQEYVTVMAIEVLDDVQEPTGLSIPTAIAGDWIKNPFTTALPIVEEDSNVKMDVMSQDPIVLVTISFDEDMKEFDKE